MLYRATLLLWPQISQQHPAQHCLKVADEVVGFEKKKVCSRVPAVLAPVGISWQLRMM